MKTAFAISAMLGAAVSYSTHCPLDSKDKHCGCNQTSLVPFLMQ